jgi:hypothetical protein
MLNKQFSDAVVQWGLLNGKNVNVFQSDDIITLGSFSKSYYFQSLLY